ncbi:MAG: hypothetical protein VYA84_05655 [Planctomycetota bacterium]|nr:hypothetical protein [Planctomycetota bacterium]
MIVTPCPRCQETFRIPTSSLPEDAQAICPWCQEQFALTEVIDQLPPVLGVVHADGTPIDIASPTPQPEQAFNHINGVDTGSSAETDSTQWADLSIDDREANTEYLDGERWSVRGTSPVPSLGEMGAGGQEPILTRASSRKRKKGSGIRTAIGVVLGGLAALPIAGGILMLMGKTPDWGIWPFDGGSQDSGSGVIAAPMGNIGERSYDRPFGQSLMRSEDAEPSSEPSDSALQSILDAAQPTPQSGATTGETSSGASPQDVTPAEKNDSVSASTDESSANEFGDSNMVSRPVTTPPTALNSTLDAIALLNPAFDADIDLNPTPAGLEIQLTVATNRVSSTEQTPSSASIVSTEPSLNTTKKIENESLRPETTEVNVNLADDTSQVATQNNVLRQPESPALAQLSDAPVIDASEMIDTTTFDSTTHAAVDNSLMDPTLKSPPAFDAAGLSTDVTGLSTDVTGDVQIADAVEETTTKIEAEISTEPSELPTSTPTPTTARDEVSAGLNATNSVDSDLNTEAELQTPEPLVAGSMANESRDLVDTSDSPEPAVVIQATRGAIDFINRLATFEGVKQKRNILIRDTYLKVAEVCDDTSIPGEDIEALAETIATSSAIDEIENAGLQWLQHGRRQFNGVAVAGLISQNDGKTTLLLSNGARLNLLQDPDFPTETKVLMLGRIVDDSTVKALAIEAIR